MNDHVGRDPTNLLQEFSAASCAVPSVPIYDRLTAELEQRLEPGNGWHVVLGEGGIAHALMSERRMLVRIEDGGSVWYSVQLSFLPLSLQSGREYRVGFRVRSARDQKMILDVAEVGTWYSYCPRVEFVVTPTWQDMRATFSMGSMPSEPKARFEFNLGACAPNEILFEQVVVTRM